MKQRDAARRNEIKARRPDLKMITFKACHVKALHKSCERYRTFCKQYDHPSGPLLPRDGLYGGVVCTFQDYCVPTDEEKIYAAGTYFRNGWRRDSIAAAPFDRTDQLMKKVAHTFLKYVLLHMQLVSIVCTHVCTYLSTAEVRVSVHHFRIQKFGQYPYGVPKIRRLVSPEDLDLSKPSLIQCRVLPPAYVLMPCLGTSRVLTPCLSTISLRVPTLNTKRQDGLQVTALAGACCSVFVQSASSTEVSSCVSIAMSRGTNVRTKSAGVDK